MRYKIERMGIHVMAFVVGRCNIAGMYPFVVPYFMAAYLADKSSMGLFVTLLLGVASTFAPAECLRYGLILIFLLCMLKKTERDMLFSGSARVALASGMILWGIGMPFEYIVTGNEWMPVYTFLEGVVAVCMTLVFEQGFYSIEGGPYLTHVFERRMRESSDETLIMEVTKKHLDNFGQAFITMETMLSMHEEEYDVKVPNGLSNIYLSGDGISLLNAVESESNRLYELRRNFIKQLKQVGEIISSFQGEIIKSPVANFEPRLKNRMAGRGIIVSKAVCFRDKTGRLQIFMRCRISTDNIVSGKMLATCIGKILKRPIVCIERSDDIVGAEDSMFSFVEKGRYVLTTGVCRCNREGEDVCGDNYSVIRLDNGKAVFMISDGMGSGETANIKSKQIMELLEKLLSAGFGRELAIELVNSFVSFITEGSFSSTLDLTMFDLYSGVADFVKMGASATFIRHECKVECIRSTSLPAGVLEDIEFDTCARKLYHGDVVVMVSDGILDGLFADNKEEYLGKLIAESKTDNMQKLAQIIMDEVCRTQQDGLRDDSTVLAIGIWER
ncbi:MAG: SpoIIE family protein phosphatase [Lachnospiraceae bacterium]|nr:SpoIIE family protein phosphatase [Lachnospiraceae bacterium]